MAKDYVQFFSELPTTCVSDGLDGQHALDYSIKPLASYSVTGRAYTVKLPKGQNKEVLRAIKEASPGDVLVIDAGEDTSRAIAGDFILGMAQTLGIAGVVTNGVIRDVEDIQTMNFPVFCKGTTTVAGSKAEDGLTNIPISIGGVIVKPGDIIVGDLDGVVVVPKEIEKETLEKAKKKLEKDEAREAKVSGNVEEIHKYIDRVLEK